MCDMCDENGMTSCQDCGILICFDIKGKDDFIAPAYVTNSGDVFCRSCGRQHDLAEWEDEGETYFWPGDDYYHIELRAEPPETPSNQSSERTA